MKLTIDVPGYKPIITQQLKLEIGCEFQFLIIRGSNGSGKSTIFNILMGLIVGNSNPEIICSTSRNLAPIEESFCPIKIKNIFRYLPQVTDDALFSMLSVEDNVNVLKLIFNIDESTDNILNILKYNKNIAIFQLSVGQKKIFLMEILILSLSLEPDSNTPLILLLDEPFSGLDEKNKNIMFEKILELKGKYGKRFKIIIIDHIHLKYEKKGSKLSKFEVRNNISLSTIQTDKIELK